MLPSTPLTDSTHVADSPIYQQQTHIWENGGCLIPYYLNRLHIQHEVVATSAQLTPIALPLHVKMASGCLAILTHMTIKLVSYLLFSVP